MSKAQFRIAFDGEALASHTMDVRDLAPSLLGLGEVIVEANRVLNGKDVKVSINITPNIERRCFDIGLEIVQHWEAIKRLLGHDDVVAAKTLIDWLLLGGGPTALICVILKARGKKPVNIIRFNDEHGNPLYRYQFDGAEDQILDEKVHKLYQNGKIRTQFGRLLRPLIQRPGIDEFVAYEPEKRDQATRITKREAQEVDFSYIEPEEEPPASPDDPFEATLRVYSPVYDTSAPRWRFWFGGEHYYMDVSDSNIRDLVFANGGALMDDRFRVRLQRTVRENEKGEEVEGYKVLEVIEFIPAYRQPSLFYGNGNDEPEESEPDRENP